MKLHQRIRRQQGRHADDWLITYADTITLLLCLFVIMLSTRTGVGHLVAAVPGPVAVPMNVFDGRGPFPVQSSDVGRSDVPGGDVPRPDVPPFVTPAGEAAPEDPSEPEAAPVASAVARMDPGPARPPVPARTREPHREAVPPPADPLPAMVERLRFLGAPVAARQGDRITTLQIGSTAFFGSGAATLSGSGKAILGDVAITLKSDALAGYRISIEGHTDDTPINTTQFQSNWELSTARAAAVVRFLVEQGIPAYRLTAAGYADTFPIAPNRTTGGVVIPENQAKNRRVVIRLEKIDKVDR